MSKPSFGDRITVNSVLVRQHNYDKTAKYHRMWVASPCKPTEVRVIGERTLANGNVYYIEDEGRYFEGHEYFRCLLVVESMYTKPFYTPKEKL